MEIDLDFKKIYNYTITKGVVVIQNPYGKWKDLLPKLEEVVLDNLVSQNKRSLSKVFSEFAETHAEEGITFENVSYYYYKYISKKIKELVQQDESSADNKEDKPTPKEINTKETETVEQTKHPEPKVGDIIEVKIAAIKEYGAFGNTREGRSCLIHISEITDGFVENASDYFKTGQIVKAKLLKILPDGKLSLSTRALSATAGKDGEPNQGEIIKKAPAERKMASYVAVPNANIESEQSEMLGFIKMYSGGHVSSKAVEDINLLIQEFGVFKSTLAMVEVLRDLDISSYITSETMKKLNVGERLRRSQ